MMALLLRRQLPLLIKEPRRRHLAGVPAVLRRRGVDDREVGQLRDLAGIVEVVVLAEREAAVEHDVVGRGEWVREDYDRHVRARVLRPRPSSDLPAGPGSRDRAR